MKGDLRRREGWARALEDEIRRADARPFWWGIDDCSLFAANVVWRMTGTDLAILFRGTYHSAPGAVRSMRRLLGVSDVEALAETIAGRIGIPEVAPRRARRGDMVLIDADAGPALGVVDTSGRRIAAKGPDGIWLYDLALARRAWHIG